MKKAKKENPIDEAHGVAIAALDLATDAWENMKALPDKTPIPEPLYREWSRFCLVACSEWKKYKDLEADEFLRSYKPSIQFIGKCETGEFPTGGDSHVFDKIKVKQPDLKRKWKTCPPADIGKPFDPK